MAAGMDAMRTETEQVRSQLTMLRRRHDAVEGKIERLRDAYIYRAAIDREGTVKLSRNRRETHDP